MIALITLSWVVYEKCLIVASETPIALRVLMKTFPIN
jgi:hypothetical protein